MERRGNSERPSFREAVLFPITYARELAGRGIQRRDIPILVAVGLLESALVANVAMGFEANGPVDSTLYFLATNAALDLGFAVIVSAAPGDL